MKLCIHISEETIKNNCKIYAFLLIWYALYVYADDNK